MDKAFYEILACPLCKGSLEMNKERGELVCRPCGVAYPIRDGFPVMLPDQARTLDSDERLKESKK